VYFVTLTENVLNLLDCKKKCISQLLNFLIGEPIEELANLSNYRYFARIDRTNQAYIISGQCNRLKFDFPIGPLAADR